MYWLLIVGLAGAGCWTSSSAPPAAPDKAMEAPASGSAATGSADGSAATGGILGSDESSGGAFASLTGTGDLSSGFDDPAVYGGLIGNATGDTTGGLGAGSGSATGTQPVGIGRYGTLGHGVGTGSGYGVGGGGGHAPHRAVPAVSLGVPTIGPGLNKAIVRRYVKRNIQRIQYCYEKELLAKPGLAGEVVAVFTIGSKGLVTTATATGIPGVDACIASVIGAIEFPTPSGATALQVKYPFVFKSEEQ